MNCIKRLVFGIFLPLACFAQTPTNVQKGGAAGTNNITADLNIATGRTLTIASGGSLNIAGSPNNGIVQTNGSLTLFSTLTPSGLTSLGVNSITSAALSGLTLGTGTFGTSVSFASATGIPTFNTHIVMEGVTSTGATGTGNLVFSASPTFTGTVFSDAFKAGSIAGTGEPTFTGLIRIAGQIASASANGGLEFKTNALSNGHGWRLVALDDANDSFLIQNRSGSATWTTNISVLFNGETSFASTTEATTLGAGSLTTAGGIYAAKKIITRSSITPFSTAGIVGTTTNDNTAAGSVGEFVETLKAIGAPVSLTTATPANVISISLTAGDWDVSAIANFTETTATVTARSAGISSTSATLPTDGSEGYDGATTVALSETNSITLARKRMSLAGTTTVFLVASATFSAGTIGGFGQINARRVR